MQIQTKFFGVIDLAEDKIIEFEQGLVGFDTQKKFTLIYDIEDKEDTRITWLQSVDMPELAIPLMNPFSILPSYNPMVQDDWLQVLGQISEKDLILFVTLTVPKDVKDTSVNLKAPILVNTTTKKGCQLILDNPEYDVKFKIYDILKTNEKGD
jgi:flagellar assembly factor FliW